MTKQLKTQSVTLRPPWGGMNALIPFSEVQPPDCIYSYNFLPYPDGFKLRQGVERRNYNLGGEVYHIATITTVTGTQKLIAFANSLIQDCTSTGGTPTDLTGALTVTSDTWRTLEFKGYLFCVNGADQAVKIDGTPTATAAAFTGPAAGDAAFFTLNSYKGRLYFTERLSLTYWYTNSAGAITGACTSVDLSTIFKRGGYLYQIVTWSFTDTNGLKEVIAFITTEGEVAVYSGLDPTDTDWQIISLFDIPKPIAPGAHVKLGGEAIIYTLRGPINLTQAIVSGNVSETYYNISNKMVSRFLNWSDLFGPSVQGFGVIEDRKNGFLIFNVRQQAATSSRVYTPGVLAVADQYVMQLATGSWYVLGGIDALCWARIESEANQMVFGTPDGTIGRITEDTVLGPTTAYIDYNTTSGAATAYYANNQIVFPYMDLGTNNRKSIKSVSLTNQSAAAEQSCTVGLVNDYKYTPSIILGVITPDVSDTKGPFTDRGPINYDLNAEVSVMALTLSVNPSGMDFPGYWNKFFQATIYYEDLGPY